MKLIGAGVPKDLDCCCDVRPQCVSMSCKPAERHTSSSFPSFLALIRGLKVEILTRDEHEAGKERLGTEKAGIVRRVRFRGSESDVR